MAYSPILTGGVVIEVPKKEYEELVRTSEKVEAVKRIVAASEYVSAAEILTVLGIERKDNKNVASD